MGSLMKHIVLGAVVVLGLSWLASAQDTTSLLSAFLVNLRNGTVDLSAVPASNATLGAPSNGVLKYCSDCTIANPCAGGGTGALAKRLNGSWICN